MIDQLPSNRCRHGSLSCSGKTGIDGVFLYIALNPPSRFRTQLFAYLFVAKNRAASATSEASPKRPRGMESTASDRRSGVMARIVH